VCDSSVCDSSVCDSSVCVTAVCVRAVWVTAVCVTAQQCVWQQCVWQQCVWQQCVWQQMLNYLYGAVTWFKVIWYWRARSKQHLISAGDRSIWGSGGRIVYITTKLCMFIVFACLQDMQLLETGSWSDWNAAGLVMRFPIVWVHVYIWNKSESLIPREFFEFFSFPTYKQWLEYPITVCYNNVCIHTLTSKHSVILVASLCGFCPAFNVMWVQIVIESYPLLPHRPLQLLSSPQYSVCTHTD